MNGLTHRLAIIGTGGHGREAAWLAECSGVLRQHICFIVEKSHFERSHVNGITVRTLESGACDGWPFIVAIGDPTTRLRIAEACVARGMVPTTIMHPSIQLHESTVIGNGCLIASGAIVTVNTVLGDHVHINVKASVSHDVMVGDGTTVSPGATIAGHVTMGKRVFVGIGATVINGSPTRQLTIGDDAFIAAGACVVGDISAGMRVMGIPARAL